MITGNIKEQEAQKTIDHRAEGYEEKYFQYSPGLFYFLGKIQDNVDG
jgi:hypothetical protein